MAKALITAAVLLGLAFIVSSAIQSGGIDRGTTLSHIKEEMQQAGFTSAAVLGEHTIQNDEEGITKAIFYVLVGKQDRKVDNPDTEPCRATVTWERGTLTLKSRTSTVQVNTNNVQALTLAEYAGCG